ncbi:MAG TPA: sugar phosphate isomerase/epimerase family protein [Desulfosporosinus sp.]|nr:sugar phosphate isomerase/epimerase family protein [Desulfosporosinus sp.]
MKLGAITNGISQDFERAMQVMQRDGIGYAELQFIWEKEICHHTEEENKEIKRLLDKYGIKVACIMKHVFNGMPLMDTEIGDTTYNEQINLLRKSIQLARFFDTNITRTMTFAKQNVVFGAGGAEKYLSGGNKAWIKLLKLMEPACLIAEDEKIDLMMETGTGAFIHSASLAKKLIDDLGSPRLKILWDPANCLYSQEHPMRTYEVIREHIADVHIKDIRVNKPMASIVYCPLGHGEMGQFIDDLALALRQDKYAGVVTFENQVIPSGGEEEDGWNQSVALFKEVFE